LNIYLGCGDAYESDKTEDKAKKISACQSGCSQQRSVPEITLAPAAPKSLLDLLMGGNNMFEDDSHRKGGLTVSFGVPWMIQTSNLDDGFGFFLISNFQLFAVGHHNPLEQIFDNKDVEIFDPKEAFQKSTTEEEREDFIAPILREIDNSIAHQAANDHASVYGNDFVEGPRLPETGLRSRPYHHIRDICLMDSHKM
jgi:hypothetical protein